MNYVMLLMTGICNCENVFIFSVEYIDICWTIIDETMYTFETPIREPISPST